MDDWPFENTPKTAVLTTRQVLEGAAILYVTHDADDGSWQFHTGGPVTSADARIVGLGEICRRDPGLRELADLPEGWQARRDRPGAPWRRFPASRDLARDRDEP
jgi:hypothetical protein